MSAVPVVLWPPAEDGTRGSGIWRRVGSRAGVGAVVSSPFDASIRALHAERFEPPPYLTVEQIVELRSGTLNSDEGAS